MKITTTVNGEQVQLTPLSYTQQIELFGEYVEQRRDELARNLDALKVGDAGRIQALERFENESTFDRGILRLPLRCPFKVIETACAADGVDAECFQRMRPHERMNLAARLLDLEVRPLDPKTETANQ